MENYSSYKPTLQGKVWNGKASMTFMQVLALEVNFYVPHWLGEEQGFIVEEERLLVLWV
jgi:hypothetical protein